MAEEANRGGTRNTTDTNSSTTNTTEYTGGNRSIGQTATQENNIKTNVYYDSNRYSDNIYSSVYHNNKTEIGYYNKYKISSDKLNKSTETLWLPNVYQTASIDVAKYAGKTVTFNVFETTIQTTSDNPISDNTKHIFSFADKDKNNNINRAGGILLTYKFHFNDGSNNPLGLC